MCQLVKTLRRAAGIDCSPLHKLAEDLVHGRVLLALLVDYSLDDLVLALHILEVLAGLIELDLGLELAYRNEEVR